METPTLRRGVYDALITVRPYEPAFSCDEAVSILREETDRGLWDPQITETFVETLKTATCLELRQYL
jgi:HD-GYP domain-containing protein (c-di-GMP phosphodiesterase class II)